MDITVRKYRIRKKSRKIISILINADPESRKTDIVYICIKSLNFLSSRIFIPSKISNVWTTGVTGSSRLTVKNIRPTTKREIMLSRYLGKGCLFLKSKKREKPC